ncbi:MAG: DNA polymerase III subunit beta [Synechococcales bacterium]|nr:DNA polymerase III subunit beta [Cyanobacteria bacterium REEB459]MEB3126388.1 DNA polymerase III subunit beta [Synechococcales bacterium]
MKFICTQKDLSTHLSFVSRAVPSRPTHPVLANIFIHADLSAHRVTLVGFDLSLGIKTSFSAQVLQEGRITVPAKLLTDIVVRLPDGDLTLELVEDTISLTSIYGQYEVRGMSADEFPELPVIQQGEVMQLPIEGLLSGLQGSLYAASTDETKQILTGVHLVTESDALEFAATDGHRLSVVVPMLTDGESVTTDHPRHSLDVTIPAKTLRELERMLASQQEVSTVDVWSEPGQVIFEWGDQRLTSRLLEGSFPNYRQLLPRQFSRQMTAERRLFTAALERIAVIADRKNNIVKLTLDPVNQVVVLQVDAQEVGSGRESLPAQISGEPLDVAFNVKYLLDGLKSFSTTEVQLQLNTATSPVILHPLGGTKMTYLVMPVQIRS